MKRESFIQKIREVQESATVEHSKAYTSHFIVGVDLTEDGSPGASLMISHGKPFETIGMIDLLIKNLQDTKKSILDKMSTKNQKKMREASENVEDMLDKLPTDVKEKLLDLKNRMEDALKKGDFDELEKLKDELRDFKNPFEDDDDSFNISDFKGGL
jgi:gas vesicle protein